MKKLFAVVFSIAFACVAYAYEKGEYYVSPTIGYHFFDEDHDLDNNAEAGLRFGKFLSKDYSIELEGAFSPTENDKKNDDQNATSLSLNSLMHFNASETVKPFVFLGLGGFFHDENHAALVAGVGARFLVTDSISIDARLKDMLMTKTRNDIIPSISLNYAFGKAKPAMPAPEPAKKPMPKKPEDSDRDGILDKDDKCPHTKSAYIKYVNTDGCVPDTDGDGIYDYRDKCQGTPAGLKVDFHGCLPDTDGDGILDHEDRCPNTMKGVEVNSAGCFESATLNINFKTNSNQIESGYSEEIERFATFLKVSSNINVEIQGHTDSKGSAVYNKNLSQRRADAVRMMLIKKYGVSSNRLTAVGYGEEQPIAPNDTPENMRKNRRIETKVR